MKLQKPKAKPHTKLALDGPTPYMETTTGDVEDRRAAPRPVSKEQRPSNAKSLLPVNATREGIERAKAAHPEWQAGEPLVGNEQHVHRTPNLVNTPRQTVHKSSNLVGHGSFDGLEGGFAAALRQLIAASGGRIWIVSGHRDSKRQAQLYADAVKKYGAAKASHYVAPPGHSNHEKGIAADLGGDLNLAHQLAERFGLHFPMPWEKWHIEPVGSREQSSPLAYTYPPGVAPPENVQFQMEQTAPVDPEQDPHSLIHHLGTLAQMIGPMPNLAPDNERSGEVTV